MRSLLLLAEAAPPLQPPPPSPALVHSRVDTTRPRKILIGITLYTPLHRLSLRWTQHPPVCVCVRARPPPPPVCALLSLTIFSRKSSRSLYPAQSNSPRTSVCVRLPAPPFPSAASILCVTVREPFLFYALGSFFYLPLALFISLASYCDSQIVSRELKSIPTTTCLSQPPPSPFFSGTFIFPSLLAFFFFHLCLRDMLPDYEIYSLK
jgi:hypothetical protein